MNIFTQYQNPMMGISGGFAGFGGFVNSGFGYNGCPSAYSGMSAGGATSAFLGGAFSFSRTPVYQQQAHYRALFENYTEQQKKVTEGSGKMWDVWFDHKDGQKTKRVSPIVLDLNGDGKAGITGQNITGDGKVSGQPINFDIDPSRVSWAKKSRRRRPGKGAPKVKGGHWEGDQYLDKKGNVIGEKRGKFYYWGNKTSKEKTEWLAKNGGDGLLVWDTNNDGKITSSKELFGNFDINGKKRFKSGYEKLAHYFDKNKDGQVNGEELKGLKVWADKNGNGKVEKGELKAVSAHNISSLNTNYNSQEMTSNFGTRTETTEEVQRQRFAGWETTLRNVFAGWRNDFSFGLFGGASHWGW